MASSLEAYIKPSSGKGLSSITTLIVGVKSAILIDPPFLVPDALEVVSWIKRTTDKNLQAVFVTHHHPDHFFSVNPFLEAFPSAVLYAAPYVCTAIDREYEEKVKYWSGEFGKDVPEAPTKPTPYGYSFTMLDGNASSPIMLLGPVQGDCVDHTLFWLPTEKTIITGDAYVQGVRMFEIETPEILHAWQTTINLIESLEPAKIIVGRMEAGWELDAKADLEHNKKYLALFQRLITEAPNQPSVEEIYETFKNAFPQADNNLDFFLGHLSNQYGKDGKIWEENRQRGSKSRTEKDLEGFAV